MTFALSDKAAVTIESFPFRHAVVEQVFSAELADAIMAFHRRSIPLAVHAGRLEDVGPELHSARSYTPDRVDIASSAVSALFSQQLRQFIGGLLSVPTNDCIMLHLNRHDPPSTSGIPHNDCGVVCFPFDGGYRFNGSEVYQPDNGVFYPDDTRDHQPTARKVARSLACLYYVGNQDWQPGDGGETALYAPDKKTILKTVPPIHNSLFVFDTSPISFHGYLGSPKSIRDSFIWWYHDEVESVTERHQELFADFESRGIDPWGRWTPPEVPKYKPGQATISE